MSANAAARGPLTLGIDTATCVAVGIARGDQVLATVVVDGSRAHVEQLMPAVQRACAEAAVEIGEINQVVVGLGPGPFTGLRVGIVTAQVLADAVGASWRGVCTLDVLAAQAAGSAREFIIATDARRREVYWAHYRDGQRILGPQVGPAAQLLELAGDGTPMAVFGPGAALYPETAERAQTLTLDPGVLAARGWELPDVGVEPLYLRRPDATVGTKRKSALPRSRR